jgi:hypothetical protein
VIELPDWIDPQTWDDFEEMRRKMRKPLTDAARRLAIKRLLFLYREHRNDPQEVLEQSILNSWQGLWPISQGFGRRQEDEAVRRELRVGTGPQVRRQ